MGKKKKQLQQNRHTIRGRRSYICGEEGRNSTLLGLRFIQGSGSADGFPSVIFRPNWTPLIRSQLIRTPRYFELKQISLDLPLLLQSFTTRLLRTDFYFPCPKMSSVYSELYW